MTTLTTIDKIVAEISGFKEWAQGAVKSGVAPVSEELARFKVELQRLNKLVDAEARSRYLSVGEDSKLTIREGRFAGYTALDLAMLYSVLRFRLIRGLEGARRETLEELEKARQELRKGISYDTIYSWEERCLKLRRAAAGYQSDSPGMAVFKQGVQAWRSSLMDHVHKAMDSTTAGSGDELVPTFEAAEVWMDVNLETKVLPLFRQSPMPTNPFDIPGQLGDMNWYPTAENEQVTTTTPTTTKTTLTAYELKAGLPFSDTLEEDSIIALVPEIRSNMARNAAEIIDDVLVNGDTTTTNGINSDGATISKSTAGKAHWLLGFDGLIHLPIIDNTAQRKAHSNTITAGLFNNNLIKLGRYAAPGHRGDVVHISDINTLITALTIAQVETVDKFGPRATVSSGELAGVYGVPYLVSEQMKLADTDGKVTDSGGNTTGRVLTVNTTQWRTGFRRAITFEPDREPGKSQTTLYVGFRIAFTERSGTRSSASHTAIQYDISSVT